MKEYALYKGDTCLAIGTIKEIAEQMKLKEKTIKFYGTPSHIKRMSKSHIGNFKILIKLD